METDRRKADRWTDMTELVVAFRSFASSPKTALVSYIVAKTSALTAALFIISATPHGFAIYKHRIHPIIN